MPSPYINWLASYPKSGNTWVRAFLEHYENGCIDINNMNVVLGDEAIYYYQAVSCQPVHTFDLYQWAMVRPAALNMYLFMNPSKDRIILKTHNAYATIADIPLFPPLLFGPSVYLLRNPIDLIPSFARHSGHSLDDMIRLMSNNNHVFAAKPEKNTMIGLLSSWSNHVTVWSQAPNTLVIRYEDLLENPEYWFAKVLEQFGYEINKTRLIEAIEASSLGNLMAQEKEVGFKEVGKNDVFFGGTTEKLNPTQISKVIKSFENVMSKFGYIYEELKDGSYN